MRRDLSAFHSGFTRFIELHGVVTRKPPEGENGVILAEFFISLRDIDSQFSVDLLHPGRNGWIDGSIVGLDIGFDVYNGASVHRFEAFYLKDVADAFKRRECRTS